MGRVGHKRQHKNIRDLSRKYRTRARTKDLDQIHNDLNPSNKVKLLNQPLNPDLPGGGQFYCVECSRHFIDELSKAEHTRSKQHRRRMKELKDGPYTQKDAEMAAGMAPADNGKRSSKTSAEEVIPINESQLQPDEAY